MTATVRHRGLDTSGRPVYASDYLWTWWQQVTGVLGWTPTIVQGAWMSRVPGGGAEASAGYHDQGGCLDLRTWDRSQSEVDTLVRTLRRMGAAAWVRDHRHGMDPHLHLVLGTDHNLAAGARWQWAEYLAGRDGLTTRGPDYHWRPRPLVTTPPPEEDELTPDDLTKIRAIVREEVTKAVAAAGDTIKVDMGDGKRPWSLATLIRSTWKRTG